jgi:2-dehydropantoate 2-reductase
MHATFGRPRIAVLGAGLIGCYLGGRLLAGGSDVRLMGRESLANELRQAPLKITDWQGGEWIIPSDRVHVSTDPSALADADIVLVTVKSKDTADAASQIAVHGKPSVVVSFQNGVKNGETLRRQLSSCVLCGMVPFNVTKPSAGHFHCASEGTIVLESRPQCDARLCSEFQTAAMAIHLTQQIDAVLWGKLLMNLNNAINALAGIPLREELSQRGYRLVLARSIREGLLATRRAGIRPAKTSRLSPRLLPLLLSLPDWLFTRLAGAVLQIDPTARSSMWEDLERKRPTEIQYLNGEIVALAEHHGISAPTNRGIVELIAQAERNADGSPRLSADALIAALRGDQTAA